MTGASWSVDPVEEAQKWLPHAPGYQLAENKVQYEGANLFNGAIDLTAPNVVKEIYE